MCRPGTDTSPIHQAHAAANLTRTGCSEGSHGLHLCSSFRRRILDATQRQLSPPLPVFLHILFVGLLTNEPLPCSTGCLHILGSLRSTVTKVAVVEGPPGVVDESHRQLRDIAKRRMDQGWVERNEGTKRQSTVSISRHYLASTRQSRRCFCHVLHRRRRGIRNCLATLPLLFLDQSCVLDPIIAGLHANWHSLMQPLYILSRWYRVLSTDL